MVLHFQVFIRIKDEEWTVYRRYSEFYELHVKLKKKAPIVNTFCFPPKKALGNKVCRQLILGLISDSISCKIISNYMKSQVNQRENVNNIIANQCISVPVSQ